MNEKLLEFNCILYEKDLKNINKKMLDKNYLGPLVLTLCIGIFGFVILCISLTSSDAAALPIVGYIMCPLGIVGVGLVFLAKKLSNDAFKAGPDELYKYYLYDDKMVVKKKINNEETSYDIDYKAVEFVNVYPDMVIIFEKKRYTAIKKDRNTKALLEVLQPRVDTIKQIKK